MFRRIFLCLIIIGSCCRLFSQPRPVNVGSVEANLISEADDSFCLYLSFRIAYSDLIFAKENDLFKSGAEFSCEIYDGEKLVDRKSVSSPVQVSDYSATENSSSFIQSLLVFKLYKANFSLKPAIYRNNTNLLMPMRPVEINIIGNERIIRPVIVSAEGNKNEFVLVNKEGKVPYDNSKYTLLIPVPDSLNNASLKIQQRNKTLLEKDAINPGGNSLSMSLSGNAVSVSLSDEKRGRHSYFAMALPDSVDEGDIQVMLEKGKKKVVYNIQVVWEDKPNSLQDINSAVKLMDIITDGKISGFILSQPSEERYFLLKREWNRMTNYKSPGLNPLMKEFYSRADYAVNNFSSNHPGNGAETDRGRIYIQFGKPDKVERIYNDKNEISEIWSFSDLKREFIFEDTSGKGNYILRK